MVSKIIKIGKSNGVIIPNEFLKRLHFKDRAILDIEKEKLVIKPVKKKPRENWENIIKEELEKHGSSEALSPDFFADGSLEDWTW